jgi:hypothetical protein
MRFGHAEKLGVSPLIEWASCKIGASQQLLDSLKVRDCGEIDRDSLGCA